jgi:cytochrome b
MPQQNDKKEILVWDRATRVFHWFLVVMVVVCWITSEIEDDLFWTHLISGYIVLLLVLFRLVWGVLGGRHARFTDFVRGWSAILGHARGLLRLKPARHVGHNPLGGWMILTLLAMLALTVVTGLFAGDDDEAGPYALLIRPDIADALSEVHEALFGVLLFLAALHILGVLADSLLGRENLVRAMWTGSKRVPSDDPEGDAAEPSIWRFLIALILAAMGLAAVIWGAPV